MKIFVLVPVLGCGELNLPESAFTTLRSAKEEAVRQTNSAEPLLWSPAHDDSDGFTGYHDSGERWIIQTVNLSER